MLKNILIITLIILLVVNTCFNKKSNPLIENLNTCPLPKKTCLEEGYTKRFCSLRPENIIGPHGCFCDEEGSKGLLGRKIPENNCKCACWPGIV